MIFRAYGVEIIRKAAASHRLADVQRGAAAGHRVDDQGTWGGVVMEGVADEGRRDRARVGDAESAVVPERPDVVRRRDGTRAEAVAAAKVLISRVDRLGTRRRAAPERFGARASPASAIRQTARAWR